MIGDAFLAPFELGGCILTCSRQHNRHVVGLFFAANPIEQGVHNLVRDSRQRQFAVLLHARVNRSSPKSP